jgi:hypothetical protein
MSTKICANVTKDETSCGREMRCIKTGMDIVVNDNLSYRADLYACMTCGTRMAFSLQDEPAYSDYPIRRDAHTIDLKQEF